MRVGGKQVPREEPGGEAGKRGNTCAKPRASGNEKKGSGEWGGSASRSRDCRVHGLSRSPLGHSALSQQRFEGLRGSFKNLRCMQTRTRVVAVFVFGALIAGACAAAFAQPQPAASGDAGAANADVVSAVFESYNADQKGASLTVEQAGHPTVFGLAPDASARERAAGQAWLPTSLARLAQGEPVTLHLSAAGLVQQVDAEYADVLTRLVVHTNGYVVTTSGKAYKLVGKAAQFQETMELGTYLKLRVDQRNSAAFDIVASSEPFVSNSLEQRVTVTFVVTVPPNTPPSDVIYLASNAANWTPNGLRMQPQPGNRWTAAFTVGRGSSFQYKYTRGSWQTDERNAAGVEIPNRTLTVVKNADSQQVSDTVARWADLSS